MHGYCLINCYACLTTHEHVGLQVNLLRIPLSVFYLES